MDGILLALGGNVLQGPGAHGTWPEMRERFRQFVPAIVAIAARGDPLVLTHGNGPQVGALLRQGELAEREVPPRPLDVLGAESQGQLGYLIQEELSPALRRAGLDRSVLTIVSRCEVARDDPAFDHPTKPVGRFYSAPEAETLRRRYGWTLVEDSARGGFRRLVPSPRPIRWLEGHAVRALLAAGLAASWIPVVAGGGGVPVVRGPDGSFAGVEAVIDKDLAAALVARELGIPVLAIVTDVPGAAVGFGRPDARWLGALTAEELGRHFADGAFAEGSMGPKVEAALSFIRGGGRRAVITDLATLPAALEGRGGTRVSA